MLRRFALDAILAHRVQPPLIELPDGFFQRRQAALLGHGRFEAAPNKVIGPNVLTVNKVHHLRCALNNFISPRLGQF